MSDRWIITPSLESMWITPKTPAWPRLLHPCPPHAPYDGAGHGLVGPSACISENQAALATGQAKQPLKAPEHGRPGRCKRHAPRLAPSAAALVDDHGKQPDVGARQDAGQGPKYRLLLRQRERVAASPKLARVVSYVVRMRLPLPDACARDCRRLACSHHQCRNLVRQGSLDKWIF